MRRSAWSALLALVASSAVLVGCDAERERADSPGIAAPATAVPSTPSPTPVAPSPTPVSTSTPTAVPTVAPTVAPRPSVPARAAATVVDRGPRDRRFIALTFDAGADAGYTAMVLDTLRAKGVRVSFGMTGQWAEQNPELVRRMAREGHDFINHTYDHGSFTGVSTSRRPLTSEERAWQVERTDEIIVTLTGMSSKPYFRPPFGDYDASVNADIARLGYTYNVMWTVDSLGWRGVPASAIVERCLTQASPGAILIFHVGSQSQDGPALGPIVDGLRAQGYELGTVRQLLGE